MRNTAGQLTIAISGVTGFVGSHLVRSLAADGHTIKAFGRTNSPPVALLRYAQYYRWDLSEQPTDLDVEQADVFIHSAGFVDFWGKRESIHEANVGGTARALQLARQLGARQFIYISSASVYDPCADKKSVTEDAPYAARYLNHYAASKVQAEQLVSASEAFESTIILRPHAIYGPGDRTLVPQILSRIRGSSFLLPGSGRARFSITHIGNLVDAVRACIDRQPSSRQIFNVADRQPVTVKCFLREVLARANPTIRIVQIPSALALVAAAASEGYARLVRSSRPPLLTLNLLNQLGRESTVSIVKAQDQLGYEARYDVAQGLDDTFVWLESIGGVPSVTTVGKQLAWQGQIKKY